MKAKFDPDTNVLTISTDLNLHKTSRSGNSTIIATTRGQQYIGKVNGKDTYLQLNVMQMDVAGGGFEIEGVGEDATAAPRKRAA
jgi:hypothetical protein